MTAQFDLIITADTPNLAAELRLLDAHGSQLAYHRAKFGAIAVSLRRGLFDLREFLRHYVEPGREAACVAEIGVCIAEKVLGQEIFLKLWDSTEPRTLRIQLPGATEDGNHLAAALARVPWETARPAAGQLTLADRNLLVRIVNGGPDASSPPPGPISDEILRVMFVFAEARGSRPLAARLERRKLRELFAKEIYPLRRVEADFLTHGVTRERLLAQIRDRSGYHIVHWSGHGQLNLLELAKAGGGKDSLSGGELLDLFTEAGVPIPRLFFLSACHSGDILHVSDWNQFFAAARGDASGGSRSVEREAPDGPGDGGMIREQALGAANREIPLDNRPGYTGTAHALLQGGVASVIAMRYAVSDDYARELGVEFYRRLFADTVPKAAATALTLARRELLKPGRDGYTHFAACDHATPVYYGAEQSSLTPRPGRSPGLDARDPRLHRIAELTVKEHACFVGRTWELTGLGSEFIGAGAGAHAKPIALVTGLGGMGKTALTAEALDLWASRFDWVLLYQAKPGALSLETMLRDIHLKLNEEFGRYHQHVQARPADAIHREADETFTGQGRFDRLARNLIRAMRDEAILLVLDNFETCLKPQLEPGDVSGDGEPTWACQDPAWDRLLATLAEDLPGAASRVLITCRRPLAALAGDGCHRVPLGPLPVGEAALYLREHAGLSRMVYGGDAAEKELATRLLRASRFHPLLLDRLARLATGGAELRPALLAAIETLEESRDYSRLPELFTTRAGGVRVSPLEFKYLDDALTGSIDGLIRDAGPQARLLLWMVALANEPVAFGLLKGAWSEGHREPAPLLNKLKAVGLVGMVSAGPDDDNPRFSCHELVRERIDRWMRAHEDDREGLTENAVRLVYAEQLETVFNDLMHQDMAIALEAGARALVYYVQAEAWDRLIGFASKIVTGSTNPQFLARLLPYLKAAVESAPEGRPRWSCIGHLAAALRMGGRPDLALPLFERAVMQAHAVAEAGTVDAHQVWSDLAWITGSWANALCDTGKLGAARRKWLESVGAEKKANRSRIHIIGGLLEVLRIAIWQGGAARALPRVERLLARVKTWWHRQCAGERVPEVSDPETLTRVLIGALDIAKHAHWAQKDWASALRCADAILEVKRVVGRPAEDIAGNRMDRANMLIKLGQLSEARTELETCLEIFRNNPAMSAKTRSSLADVFHEQGDVTRAVILERGALALREHLPDPRDRAVSHNNLAVYLEYDQNPSTRAEAARHMLAALVYRIVSGLGQDLQASLCNYAVVYRRARAAGEPLAVPRLAELLADPAFHPLADWLRRHQVNVDEVQADVDTLLDQACQAAPMPLQRLADLLAALESAVLAGDRPRATELEQLILQQLVAEADPGSDIESLVRALMQALDQQGRSVPCAKDELTRGLKRFGPERGGPASADKGVVYPVWFGTNRKPAPQGDGFTCERHDRVIRGRAEVFVPEAHRFGETGSSFWRRLLRFDLRDDRLRLQQVGQLERDAFFAEIHQAMQDARASGEQPHALFFLHGYNVSFEEAAIRAAQIGYDLKVPGATAFFSWPSRGCVTAYPADEACIEASERAITDFLVEFTANCGAEKVHVIAHSMGNRGLLRALQRIAAGAETRGRVRFGQIFLAAPDVDRDLFLDLARLYPEHSERATLYASDADLPVHLSAKLHAAPRAGYYEPYTVAPGVDTVAVPDFDVDLLGHAYFAQVEALLYDIYALMRHNEAPGQRPRIEPAAHDGQKFWQLKR